MTTHILPGDVRPVNAGVRADASSPSFVDAAVADPHVDQPRGVGLLAVPGANDKPVGEPTEAHLVPDLSTLPLAAAAAYVTEHVTREPILSDALHKAAIRSAVLAVRKSHEPDNLFSPALSRLSSVVMSLQRREGGLLNDALLAAIDACPRLLRLDVEPIAVTADVLDQVEREGPARCTGFDLDPAGETVRRLTPDAMFIDLARNVAVVLELKRGGPLGAEHARWLARDVATSSLCIRHHVRQRGFHVRFGEAGIVVFRPDAGLRVEGNWAMTVAAFDERFGTKAAATVEAVRRTHAAAAALVLRPLQIAALREAEAAARLL